MEELLKEILDAVRTLQSVQERLISRIDAVEHRLSRIEEEVRSIREKQIEQDGVLDVLAVRTTRLEGRLGSQ